MPYDCQKDESGSAAKYQQTDRSVTSGNEYADHHVVDFFKDCIYFSGFIECMVSCACGVQ